jgi:hypothetical protein
MSCYILKTYYPNLLTFLITIVTLLILILDLGLKTLMEWKIYSPAKASSSIQKERFLSQIKNLIGYLQYSGHFWERAVSLAAYAPVESGYFIQVSLLQYSGQFSVRVQRSYPPYRVQR